MIIIFCIFDTKCYKFSSNAYHSIQFNFHFHLLLPLPLPLPLLLVQKKDDGWGKEIDFAVWFPFWMWEISDSIHESLHIFIPLKILSLIHLFIYSFPSTIDHFCSISFDTFRFQKRKVQEIHYNSLKFIKIHSYSFTFIQISNFRLFKFYSKNSYLWDEINQFDRKSIWWRYLIEYVIYSKIHSLEMIISHASFIQINYSSLINFVTQFEIQFVNIIIIESKLSFEFGLMKIEHWKFDYIKVLAY